MTKIIYFFIGIFFISVSTLFMFLYLNLFNIGYNFFEYLLFCFKRFECLLIIPGMILVYFHYLR